MSDYHIMAGIRDENRYTVVFHYPVPSADNDASPAMSYQAALIQWLGGTQPSVVPFIDGTEQTALDAGQLYEVNEQFSTNPQETLAQKIARLDAQYTSRLSTEQEDLQEVLRYWGHGRDVP